MTKKLMAATAAVVCAAAVWSAGPANASTTWRVQAVPQPAGAAGAWLQGVSCPSAGVCMAVGFSADSGASESNLAEQWRDGTWTILPTPNGSSSFNQLTSVSCLSATDCAAVGINGGLTMAEHWDGASWTVQPMPNPANAQVAELDAVSCASDTSCMATGSWSRPGGGAHGIPLAEHWDGTSWTLQRAVIPAGSQAAGLDGGVSCPTATGCIAVGSAGGLSTGNLIAERWNGKRWFLQTMPSGNGSPVLFGLSCTSTSRCTAVGAAGTGGFAERLDGQTWSIQTDAAPANTILLGVSCNSGTSCTAVGTDGSTTGVAEHWDGTSWTRIPTPLPHGTTRSVTLAAVSCVAAADCTAVGDWGSPARPLAEHE